MPLEIKPLTILIGANNSGKTSLLKPLLLMKQTMRGASSTTPLITRGALVNAGDFRDLVTNADLDNILEFQLDFHTHVPDDKKSLEHVGHYPPGSITASFKNSDAGSEMVLQKFEVRDIYGRRMLSRDRKADGNYTLTHLPARRTKGKGSARSAIDQALRKNIREARPEHFLFFGAPLFSSALSRISHKEIDSESPDEFELSEYSGERAILLGKVG